MTSVYRSTTSKVCPRWSAARRSTAPVRPLEFLVILCTNVLVYCEQKAVRPPPGGHIVVACAQALQTEEGEPGVAELRFSGMPVSDLYSVAEERVCVMSLIETSLVISIIKYYYYNVLAADAVLGLLVRRERNGLCFIQVLFHVCARTFTWKDVYALTCCRHFCRAF